MRRYWAWTCGAAILGSLVLLGLGNAADGPNGPLRMPQDTGQRGGGYGPPPGGVHLIPRYVESRLNLTDDQKKQISDLETDVKAKLAKILTADQMKTLEEARPQRGGFGGPGGGQGGPGGPGGPGGGGDSGGPPPHP